MLNQRKTRQVYTLNGQVLLLLLFCCYCYYVYYTMEPLLMATPKES